MHDTMKRHEVQVLRRAGVTQEKVAELTGISVRVVRMIEAETPVVVPDGEAERERRASGRPPKAEPFREQVAKVLAEEPVLVLLELLRRAGSTATRAGRARSKHSSPRCGHGPSGRWSATFAGVMLDLGAGVDVCWPARGNQKGSVENLVGWVKGSFFKHRRFVDEADLLAQFAAWHDEVNGKVVSRATGVTPASRMAEDRARLRPLKVAPAELPLRIPASVGLTGYVLHDTHLYSMAPDAIGIPGTLFLFQERAKNTAGRFTSNPPRLFVRNAKSTLPEPRVDAVAKVSGKRAKRHLMREHLMEIGGDAFDYLTEITHRRSGAWIGEVEQLLALPQQRGANALGEALGRAVAGQTFGAEYVRHYLLHPEPA
jgi:hypothetical protein